VPAAITIEAQRTEAIIVPQKKASSSEKPKKQPRPTKTALRVERAQIAVPHAGYRFGYKHQVFIGKLKRGEVWALNHLGVDAKIAVTPLFEMWPANPAKAGKAAKSLMEHTTNLMHMLATEWTALPCYIDTQYLPGGASPSPTYAQTVFGIARVLSVNAVPVTSPFFSQPFQQVISNVIATDGRGVMFRLPVNFFNDTQHIVGYLDGLAAALGVSKDQVDILIDLGHRPNVIEVQQVGAYCLINLPSTGEWRTVTLASGCFPNSITDVPTSTWIPFDRADWNGWFAVAGQRANANLRVPSYGDYGVRCGGEPQVIPTPAPNIRYTHAQRIWVRKGPKALGSMRAICSDLITQPYFSGAQFSQGDFDIAQRAAMISLVNGSPEQWIQWCTNHHLELTASQIRNLP
jgi:Beta protein